MASLIPLDSSLINCYNNGDGVRFPYAISSDMHVDYIVGSFNADHCQIPQAHK